MTLTVPNTHCLYWRFWLVLGWTLHTACCWAWNHCLSVYSLPKSQRGWSYPENSAQNGSRTRWGSERGLEGWVAKWLFWRWVGVYLCWWNQQERAHICTTIWTFDIWRASKSHRCICSRRSVLVGCCNHDKRLYRCPCCAWVLWCFRVL